MGWLAGYVHIPEGAGPSPKHHCPLPAEWPLGAIWRCPEGHLWQCREACPCGGRPYRHTHDLGNVWLPATWWQRRKYVGVKAAREMANENRRSIRIPTSSGVPAASANGRNEQMEAD